VLRPYGRRLGRSTRRGRHAGALSRHHPGIWWRTGAGVLRPYERWLGRSTRRGRQAGALSWHHSGVW